MSRHPGTGTVSGRDHAATRLFRNRGKHEGDEGGMTITLRHTTGDGTKGQIEFDDNTTLVDVHWLDVAHIDSTPLKACTSLQTFSLKGNKLQSLDLSPYLSCSAPGAVMSGYL